MILIHKEGMKKEVFYISHGVGKLVSTLKIDGREYDGAVITMSPKYLREAADYIEKCEKDEKL